MGLISNSECPNKCDQYQYAGIESTQDMQKIDFYVIFPYKKKVLIRLLV